MAAEIFVLGFGHLSAYITAVIGYDRYCRIRYLNSYSTVMTMSKIHGFVLVAFLLAFGHSGAHVVGIHYSAFLDISSVGLGVDFGVVLLMLLPYVFAIHAMKKHKRNSINSRLLSQVDRSITSVASRVMVAVIVLYSPFLGFSVMRRFLPASSPIRTDPVYLAFLFMGHELIYANSFTNGLIFFSIHSKCRRKLFATIWQKQTLQSNEKATFIHHRWRFSTWRRTSCFSPWAVSMICINSVSEVTSNLTLEVKLFSTSSYIDNLYKSRCQNVWDDLQFSLITSVTFIWFTEHCLEYIAWLIRIIFRHFP